jgi:Dolichyl-phosphate-mannose-protein mannosyltransferase
MAMSLRTSLRPENGPVGKALGAWLDFAPSGLTTRFLLLWFVILWTAFHVVSNASVGLHPDTLETYAWGLHPSAGYDKHPPLSALMAGAWFTVLPQTDWPFYLLAMINAAAGLYATERIGRRYFDGDKRILVPLLVLLTPFYQFYAGRFAADQTLLSTWPIATYCFLRAFEARNLSWSAAAGAAAGVAMLASYYSIFLLAGFVAAVLGSPGRWAYLRSPSPWLSAAVGGIVLAPHVQWLWANGFAPLTDAIALHSGASLAEVPWKDVVQVVETVAFVAAPLAVYWLAVRPDRETLRDTMWPSDPNGRMLVILLAVPLVLPAIVAPFIGVALTPARTMAAWFLLPVVLLRPQTAKPTRIAAIRITALVAATTICAPIAAPWLAWRTHLAGTSEGREYYRQISAEVTNGWHLATALPLAIVMGDPNLVAAATFYSPDHPDSVPNFASAASPWVTPDRLASDGWVAICTADDQNCVDEARRQTAGKTDVQFINFSTINRYLGRSGRLGRFSFILVAPETRPRIIIQ